MRRLRVTIGGYWYLVLTVAIGVVAMATSNNILYLIESLLLSGLIFSGILSERAISAIELEVRHRACAAGEPTGDRVVVSNTRGFPLFCVEVGEWHDGRFQSLAYLPHLGAREKIVLRSERIFQKRGQHRWDGYAVATSYPFGFARKTRVIDEPGTRLVWPRAAEERRARADSAFGSKRQRRRAEPDVREGEIRAFEPDDDSRLIVWPQSFKGTGLMVRVRRPEGALAEAVLDLRAEPGDAFEHAVSAAARALLGPEEGVSLTILDWQGRRRISGRIRAMNELATTSAQGTVR